MAFALLYGKTAMNTHRSERGFTLIEIVIILAIMMALVAFTMPEMFAIMNRARLEGTARQTATLMRAARLEAIKQSCYGVVMIDPANREVRAFVDNDRDGIWEPSNTPPERLIGRIELPARIRFQDELGNKDMASVEELDEASDTTLPDLQVMYEQSGSALDNGALRFADDRGNVLEVEVSDPPTTGKVEVHKWQDGAYISNGQGGTAWKFNK